MSLSRKGICLPLSPARKMVLEFMHHARRVPSLPLAKRLNVPAVAAARRDALPRPSWTAIFLRAYGLLSREHPELRRAFIPWPYRHFYEHPCCECAVLIEREWRGEQVVLGAKVRAPEESSLAALDERLRCFKEAPVEEVSPFRQILRLGRLPWVLRRFTFWQTLYLSGYRRAKRVGTCMMSSLGTYGVEQYHPLTPLTTYFTFGPVSPRGRVTAKIIYDHRVLDGRTVARCLADLEQILHADILTELRELGRGGVPGRRGVA
jgi:hypothetical protein